jgi:hypothetical protein
MSHSSGNVETPRRRLRIPGVAASSSIGLLLLIVAIGITFAVPHWRKLRLLERVARSGGHVSSHYEGPEWLKEHVGDDDADLLNVITGIWADDVDDALLAMAGQQPALTSVSVSGRDISGDGVRLLANGRRLTSVSIINATLSDTEIRELADLRHLEALELRHNALEGSGFETMSGWEHLKRLDLSYCPISDEGLSSIARLPQIESLNLTGTALTNLGVRHLAEMPELQQVNLFGTAVNNDAIPDLARIPKLKEIDLVDTRVDRHGAHLLSDLRLGVKVTISAP